MEPFAGTGGMMGGILSGIGVLLWGAGRCFTGLADYRDTVRLRERHNHPRTLSTRAKERLRLRDKGRERK
jgi:hypothetical protein